MYNYWTITTEWYINCIHIYIYMYIHTDIWYIYTYIHTHIYIYIHSNPKTGKGRYFSGWITTDGLSIIFKCLTLRHLFGGCYISILTPILGGPMDGSNTKSGIIQGALMLEERNWECITNMIAELYMYILYIYRQCRICWICMHKV